MPTRDDLVLFASYNAAMNRRLYDAAATLSREALALDRDAFFGSILGTLNHIVAGDTIWLRRFMAHPAKLPALAAMADIAAPPGLRHVYSDDLDALLAQRVRLDAVITALAAQVSDADLATVLAYTNARGACCKPFGSLLLHFFTHQTHHRGQVTTLLYQAGVDPGATDLLEWIPDQP